MRPLNAEKIQHSSTPRSAELCTGSAERFSFFHRDPRHAHQRVTPHLKNGCCGDLPPAAREMQADPTQMQANPSQFPHQKWGLPSVFHATSLCNRKLRLQFFSAISGHFLTLFFLPDFSPAPHQALDSQKSSPVYHIPSESPCPAHTRGLAVIFRNDAITAPPSIILTVRSPFWPRGCPCPVHWNGNLDKNRV